MYFRIRTWVSLSLVCCASAAKRRKNDTYEGKLAKRKAKNFYSFPKLRQSRSYLLAGKRRHTVPREYINFASSGNCAPSPASFPKLPSFSSFLLRCFVPSVTKMNKAHFVSSRTIPSSVFLGALIKMTRLVRPCQFFLALTGTSGWTGARERGEREREKKK